MTYYNNEVHLQVASGSGYVLKGGSFTLENYSVSDREDPLGNISIGLARPFGIDGKMTFRVGRKATKEVANWFRERVPASNTTFNDNPDKLNFAFLGTLKIVATGGVLNEGEHTFTFSDIIIAQGCSKSSTKLWFGGKKCYYAGLDTVICMGVSNTGISFPFHFKHGDNGSNKIKVEPKGLSNWLSNVDDSVTLSQLMIPGRKKLGITEFHHLNPVEILRAFSPARTESISRQLLNGARYFEVQVDYVRNKLVTQSPKSGWGYKGQELEKVLADVVSFLRANSDETVILDFSYARKYENKIKPEEIKSLINSLLDKFRKYIYTNRDKYVDFAKINLGEAREKIIVAFDYADYINSSIDRFYGSNKESSYEDKVIDNEQDRFENQSPEYLFLLPWIVTPNISGSRGGEVLSNQAQKLKEHIRGAQWPRLTVVFIDNFELTQIQSIVSYNFNEVVTPKYEMSVV